MKRVLGSALVVGIVLAGCGGGGGGDPRADLVAACDTQQRIG